MSLLLLVAMTYLRIETNIKLLLTSAMRHPLLFFYLRFFEYRL